MKKLGFIGMGNMAKALAKGFIDAGKIKENAIFAYAPNQEKLQKNSKCIGFILFDKYIDAMEIMARKAILMCDKDVKGEFLKQ